MKPEIVAALLVFVGGLFFLAGCIEMHLSFRIGEEVGDVRGEKRGKLAGRVEGFVDGEQAGFKAGFEEGFGEGKDAALPPRDGSGRFMRRVS